MTVAIRRAGNIIEITPPCEDILGSHFTYTKRKFTQYMGQTRIDLRDVSLYKVDGGSLFAPAGLLQRAKNVLSASGVSYSLVDLRKKKLPEPRLDLVDASSLRYGQDEALAAACACDMAQIEAPTAFGKSFLILQICQAYPTCNIIVCARQVNIINMLYDRLVRLFPGEVGRCGGGFHDFKRITVSTAKSLRKLPLARCDIFMYDEVHTSGAPETASVISNIRNAKMLGFSATTHGRFDGSELKIESLFGPLRFKMKYAEAQNAGTIAPIRVLLFDVPGYALTHMTRSHIVKRRNCFWRNSIRNRLIGAIAKMIPDDVQVLIMTETVEHAFRIAEFLPNYSVCYSSMSNKTKRMLFRGGLLKGRPPMNSDRLNYMRRQFEKGELKKVISTNIWGTGVDFSFLQVLIRADGAGGKIPNTQIPGRLSRLSSGKDAGLLVDFVDSFDPWAMHRTTQRLKVYKQHGWDAVKMNPGMFERLFVS